MLAKHILSPLAAPMASEMWRAPSADASSADTGLSSCGSDVGRCGRYLVPLRLPLPASRSDGGPPMMLPSMSRTGKPDDSNMLAIRRHVDGDTAFMSGEERGGGGGGRR